jgi:gamma-glutamylcyclotransferase (GGCT)/AIG2-like uncharacterized protein YtfP
MSGDSACRLLFVYGTLRHDSDHPMAHYLASVARFLGPASTAGRLYDLGRYPGMTAAMEPSELVWGHLFEMQDPAATLEQLDAYEGCPCGEPIPALFQREFLQVIGADGEACMAWGYTYHGELKPETRIVSGEYSARR